MTTRLLLLRCAVVATAVAMRPVSRGGASLVLDDKFEASPLLAAARAIKEKADATQRSGDFDGALRTYGEALEAASSAGSTALVAGCHVNAARCHSKLDNHDDARASCAAALDALDDDAAIPEARSLRSAALYRRATASAALGDDDAALDDASVAVALGELRADPLVRRLRAEAFAKHADAFAPHGGGPDLAAVASKLLGDPSRVAAMLPLAKQLATPAGLQGMGFEPARAEALSAFVHGLEPDQLQRWLRRLSTAFTVWRRTSGAVSFAWRVRTQAVYCTFLAWLALDSLHLALFRR